MYYVYVLENAEGKHYVGSSADLETRLRRHNQNSVRSTKNRGPWRLVYQEKVLTVTQARQRENQLKSYKGNIDFKRIINTTTPSSSLV
ncbi:MAG: GIY-YIG nuclease family protein [Candidatus Omnitrophota bacterium]